MSSPLLPHFFLPLFLDVFLTYFKLLWSFGYPKEAMEVPTIIVFHNSKTMDKIKDTFKDWFGHVYV
jgi:hypothetical protein